MPFFLSPRSLSIQSHSLALSLSLTLSVSHEYSNRCAADALDGPILEVKRKEWRIEKPETALTQLDIYSHTFFLLSLSLCLSVPFHQKINDLLFLYSLVSLSLPKTFISMSLTCITASSNAMMTIKYFSCLSLSLSRVKAQISSQIHQNCREITVYSVTVTHEWISLTVLCMISEHLLYSFTWSFYLNFVFTLSLSLFLLNCTLSHSRTLCEWNCARETPRVRSALFSLLRPPCVCLFTERSFNLQNNILTHATALSLEPSSLALGDTSVQRCTCERSRI